MHIKILLIVIYRIFVFKIWIFEPLSSNASTSNQLKWQHVFLFVKRKPWDSLNGHRHGCLFFFHYSALSSHSFPAFCTSPFQQPLRPSASQTSIDTSQKPCTHRSASFIPLIIPASRPAAPHHESCTDWSNELFSIAACSPLLVPYAQCPSETQVQKVETRWLSVLIELNRKVTVNYPYPHCSWFYVWGLTMAM